MDKPITIKQFSDIVKCLKSHAIKPVNIKGELFYPLVAEGDRHLKFVGKI